MRVLAIAAALCLSACETNLGGECQADADCLGGLTCLKAAPGGYCTQSCQTPGSTGECPGGICAQHANGLLCSSVCTGSDCRAGYTCTEVPESANLKACIPGGTLSIDPVPAG